MLAALAVLLSIAGANAQTIYESAKFVNKDLNGTARFVGMGGAMGALGGDISTMGTNPAGIGIYRSNDAMTSFSFSAFGTESKYDGLKLTNDKNHWSYDNIGFVLSSKIGNATALRYVNFGFNYHRAASFNKIMSMEGLTAFTPDGFPVTQTDQMAVQANTMLGGGYNIQSISDNGNPFDNGNAGWLAAVGWKGYLFNQSNEVIDGVKPFYAFLPQPYSYFYSKESGGIDQYDFNVAFNFNDRVYLGVTIGAYDLDYKKTSIYGEEYGNYIQDNVDYGEEAYEMTSENRIEGSGFDFKLGLIVRPIESSPLRFGFALHSPTFYRLTYLTNVRAVSHIFDGSENKVMTNTVDSYDYLDDKDLAIKYRLATPWKYNLSMGYTIGKELALGAEYEYQDYSSMKFRDGDGVSMGDLNSTTGDMKGVHTFRIGAEYKVIPEFAIRAGYNVSSAIFHENAFKNLPYYSANTDTDYANSKAMSNYTFGIGYRGDLFYADLAYKFSTYKEDFYAFENQYLQKTDVTNTRSQVLVTLGIRF